LLLAALARDARLALLAEHDGDVRAVDVRVQEADALTGRGEGGGQVRRDCGLPDAALAGAHGDDVGDPFDEPGLRRRRGHASRLQSPAGGPPTLGLRLHLLREPDIDLDPGDALDGLDRNARLAHEGARILRTEHEFEADLPLFIDVQSLDLASGDHVCAGSRVPDLFKGCPDPAEQLVAIDHEYPPIVQTAGAPWGAGRQRRRSAIPFSSRVRP